MNPDGRKGDNRRERTLPHFDLLPEGAATGFKAKTARSRDRAVEANLSANHFVGTVWIVCRIRAAIL